MSRTGQGARVQAESVGELLRRWRAHRRLSQLDLALRTDISTRHLSFVETGRSRPTPDMIMRLTEQLEVPLRERNQLLLAGGYAPAYAEHGLQEPELHAVRDALRTVLEGHEPYPALVINRWWELVDGNSALPTLITGCAPGLLERPVNVLRLSLHPDGMAPRIRNLAEWRAHVLTQLRRRVDAVADDRLRDLHEELLGYPGGLGAPPAASQAVFPLRLGTELGELALFSIHAVITTATDVTVDELAIESFYPADAATTRALRNAATH